MELKRIYCVLVILLVFTLAPVGATEPVSGIQQGIITVIPKGAFFLDISAPGLFTGK